jgi:transcriptional regulator with XRE-family HTH domain
MSEPAGPITGRLRQAILDTGSTLIALERATGVDRASIRRFLRSERSLRLDKADALAAFLGLELRKKEG